MRPTIELFTTTVDAVGMDTQMTFWASMFYIFLPVFTVYLFIRLYWMSVNGLTHSNVIVNGAFAVVMILLWVYLPLSALMGARTQKTPGVG